MKSTILLDSTEKISQVEEEEKSRFVKSILQVMGVPIEEVWTEDTLSVENKIQLRSIYRNYSIQVIDYTDGNLEFYVENQLVGKWNKPEYKIKKDLSELDPKKQAYYEMHVDCWSIFDEEN